MQENEIVMIALGFTVLIVVYSKYNIIRRVPYYKIILASLCSFVTGWIFTILESFLFNTLFNFLEHSLYACGAILLTVWAFKVIFSSGKSRNSK